MIMAVQSDQNSVSKFTTSVGINSSLPALPALNFFVAESKTLLLRKSTEGQKSKQKLVNVKNSDLMVK